MKYFMQILVILGSISLIARADIRAAQNGSSSPAQAASSQEESRTGLPKEAEAMLDRMRKKIEHQAQLAELLTQAQRLYREGEALYKSGNHKMAEESFARAREVILSTSARAPSALKTVLKIDCFEGAECSWEQVPLNRLKTVLKIDCFEGAWRLNPL